MRDLLVERNGAQDGARSTPLEEPPRRCCRSDESETAAGEQGMEAQRRRRRCCGQERGSRAARFADADVTAHEEGS